MKPLRSALVAAALATSCLASESAPTVAYLSPAVVVAFPSEAYVAPSAPSNAVTRVTPPAAAPTATPASVPGQFRGDVYALPEHTNHLPDFRALHPMNTLYTPEINVPSRQFYEGFPGVTDRSEWFGVRYVGSFQVASAGTYRFRVVSDDGARLLLDGQQVLINDGTHMPTSADGAVYLTPGSHSMVLEYFQGPRFQIALQLFWSPPGQTERIFRFDA